MSRLIKRQPRQQGPDGCPTCNSQTQRFCSTGQGLWNKKECAGAAYEQNANKWEDYKWAINSYNRHVYGKGHSL